MRIMYPDNTSVVYTYDAANKLTSVTDWAGRVTTYSYDENNLVVAETKPDGSVTYIAYDKAHRVASTETRNACGDIITGFIYTYDDLGRIYGEMHLDNNTEKWYTYDKLSRVTARTTADFVTPSKRDAYAYDAAGNIVCSEVYCSENGFMYDTNNRLISYNGLPISYDADGNMLCGAIDCCGGMFTYDSKNRLISTATHTYTYNAENTRIRSVGQGSDTTYIYDTNAKLSRLLVKTTNGKVTKYVYGRGLIGQETDGVFKTYHYDYRGSTVAVTNGDGEVTDTFEYDTYGKITSQTDTNEIIFAI